MRKLNFTKHLLLAALLFTPLSSQAALRRFGGEWVIEPKELGKYGSMVVKMDMAPMVALTKDKVDAATYVERGQIVQDELKRVLEDFAGKFKGTPGGKTLTLEAQLYDLWTGSAGSRLMGVRGHMDYMITWKDGDTIVGQLETKQPITMAVKQGAAHAAKQIIKYMKKKM
jgi:hypothetical protein